MNDANNQANAAGTCAQSGPSNQETLNASGKKPYFAPVLKHQAHLRDITLGPTEGIGESGNEANYWDGFSRSSGGGSPKSASGDSGDGGGIFEDSIFGER